MYIISMGLSQAGAEEEPGYEVAFIRAVCDLFKPRLILSAA